MGQGLVLYNLVRDQNSVILDYEKTFRDRGSGFVVKW